MDAAELPVSPGGVRPGHLGLIATGRVILGDIAATAVDLSLRGWLGIESSGDGDGGWMLSSAEPPQDSQDPAEYKRVPAGPAGCQGRGRLDHQNAGNAQSHDRVVGDALTIVCVNGQQRRSVYIDINHWYALGRADDGKPDKPEHAAILRKLLAEVDAGRLVVPLSSVT